MAEAGTRKTPVMQIILVLTLSLLGGIVKILGGILYGSKALFVDAMTCMANFVALVATIHYYRVSLIPPDEDHHFGHSRLGFGGALVSILAYSFVAGVVIVDLLSTREYTVSILAPVFAGLGFILYLGAILVAKRISYFFGPYAMFTYSELIESITVIAASLGGALYSFYIDFAGAIILTAYIFYEVYDVAKDMFHYLSDMAPPPGLLKEIKNVIESKGYNVERLRMRTILKGLYHGEAIIVVPRDMSAGDVARIIEEIVESVKKKYNVDLVISIKTR